MGSAGGDEHERLLDEQVSYYRALGVGYLNQSLDLPGGDELTGALEAFRPTGSVLKLACGPGVWTRQLLRHATDVTAADASPEMLAIAATQVSDQRVRFVQADLFTWTPDRRYDVVFFGFWLSHVPFEHFESFWSRGRHGRVNDPAQEDHLDRQQDPQDAPAVLELMDTWTSQHLSQTVAACRKSGSGPVRAGV